MKVTVSALYALNSCLPVFYFKRSYGRMIGLFGPDSDLLE